MTIDNDNEAVTSLKFSNCGNYIINGSDDSFSVKIRLLDQNNNGRIINELQGHDGSVSAIEL